VNLPLSQRTPLIETHLSLCCSSITSLALPPNYFEICISNLFVYFTFQLKEDCLKSTLFILINLFNTYSLMVKSKIHRTWFCCLKMVHPAECSHALEKKMHSEWSVCACGENWVTICSNPWFS
jgi:hypothetical protein